MDELVKNQSHALTPFKILYFRAENLIYSLEASFYD